MLKLDDFSNLNNIYQTIYHTLFSVCFYNLLISWKVSAVRRFGSGHTPFFTNSLLTAYFMFGNY